MMREEVTLSIFCYRQDELRVVVFLEGRRDIFFSYIYFGSAGDFFSLKVEVSFYVQKKLFSDKASLLNFLFMFHLCIKIGLLVTGSTRKEL